MRSQATSDPLPYVQVDRAVKPRAAMLADAIGVSRQHAMGSLIEWWDLCGDPRDLERIVEGTPKGEHPAVVLTADDARLRFRLASTRDVEPVTLARIGLLEELADNRFRVRGMSRYFEPIVRRVQAREAAAVGGRKSAKVRAETTGSAQPVGGKGSMVASVPAQAASEATSEAPTEAERKRNGSGDRSDSEADPNPSGQRSAVSDKSLKALSSSLDLLPVEPQRVKPPPALEDNLTDDEFQVFEHWRVLRHPKAKATPERKRLIAKALKVYSVADLQLAITGVTKSPHHMGENGTRTVYDDIELILRDAKHIESFLRLAGGGR